MCAALFSLGLFSSRISYTQIFVPARNSVILVSRREEIRKIVGLSACKQHGEEYLQKGMTSSFRGNRKFGKKGGMLKVGK